LDAAIAAVGSSGTITFACSGEIALDQLLTVGRGASLTLDATGYSVTIGVARAAGQPAPHRFALVEGGDLTLRNLTLTGYQLAQATPAANGVAGTPGTNGLEGVTATAPFPFSENVVGGPGTTGQAGTAGTSGASGDGADGGALYIASGNVTLDGVTMTNNSAQGGNGGNGGNGGIGGVGGPGGEGCCQADAGGNGAAGGDGGDGGGGGNGGSAAGGAVYNAGTLTVTNSTFSANSALAGDGGSGGSGGNAGAGGIGNGGSNGVGGSGANGGQGGDAVPGGDGGSAQGGAIWNTGTLSVTNTVFTNNHAFAGGGGFGATGGVGGIGGDGWPNPNQFINSGVPAGPGDGGNGGAAGAPARFGTAGPAQGGAVYDAGSGTFGSDTFTDNAAETGGSGAIVLPPGPAAGSAYTATFQALNVTGSPGGQCGTGYFGAHSGTAGGPSAGLDGVDGADASGGAVVSNTTLDTTNAFSGQLAVAQAGQLGGSGGFDTPRYLITQAGLPQVLACATPPTAASGVAGADGVATGANTAKPLVTATPGITVTPTGTPGQFQFTATVVSDSSGNPLSLSWDFGDGGTAVGPSVSHQYVKPGQFTVKLTSVAVDGTTSVISTQVTVAPPALSAGIFVGAAPTGCASAATPTAATPTPSPNPGDSVVAVLSLSADANGVGDLSDLTFTGDPLSIAPSGRLTVTSGPTPAITGPLSISPGQDLSFTYCLQAATLGQATLSTTVDGQDASGAAIPTATAQNLVSVGRQVTSVVPDIGPIDGGTPITIKGSGFGNQGDSDAVNLVPSGGGAPIAATDVVVLSDSLITAVTGAANAGVPVGENSVVTDVEVTTAGGTTPANAPDDRFTYGNQIVVNSTGDAPEANVASGACDTGGTVGDQPECTLRAAITLADSLGGAQLIGFGIAGGGVPDIAPTSALPTVENGVTIDGTTQSGGWVQLSGATAGAVSGLVVTGNTTVGGLVIDGWQQAGIQVTGAATEFTGPAKIIGDRIGTDPTGTIAVPNQDGVHVNGYASIGGSGGTSASACTGNCVLLSGNTRGGLFIGNGGFAGIGGNTIGADVTGEVAVPNAVGVDVTNDAVGGYPVGLSGPPSSTPGVGGNLISGNTLAQINISDITLAQMQSGPSGVNGVILTGNGGDATVSGDLIGVDRTGTKKLGGKYGVLVDTRDDNLPVEIQANVISGLGTGVMAIGGDVTLSADYVGTDISGQTGIGNETGVQSDFGNDIEGKNIINNDLSVKDSTISGNFGEGIAEAVTVTGDRIGTNAAGTDPIPNGTGVVGSSTIGGVRPAGSTTCTDPCNLISGNQGDAVDQSIYVSTVEGNFIGTDITGTSAIPNDTLSEKPVAVVALEVGGPSDAIRGVCDLACNLISGNGTASSPAAGVELTASGYELGAELQGNIIGETIDGAPLPNAGPGVETEVYGGNGLAASPTGFEIGGGGSNDGNVIADNAGSHTGDPVPVPGAIVELPESGGPYPAPANIQGNVVTGNGGGIVVEPGVDPVPAPPPTITSAYTAAGQLSVTGTVPIITNVLSNLGSIRIDVYADATCEPGPQGAVPLGSTTITPATADTWVFNTGGLASSLHDITATETVLPNVLGTLAGSTSVFTPCTQVSAGPVVTSASSGSAGSPTGVTTTPGGTVTGTVTGFPPGATVIATVHSTPVRVGRFIADSTGTVTFTVTIPRDITPGPHDLILTDPTNGLSADLPLTVTGSSLTGAGRASVDLDASSHDVRPGDTVTLHATISGAHHKPTPTGTVSFTDNGAAIAACTDLALPASGIVTCKLSYSITDGSPHQIVASYSGDPTYAPATATTTIRVTKIRSHLRLDASEERVTVGQQLTYRATIVADQDNASPAPTGTVTFTDDGVDITGCTNITLNTSGPTTCTVTATQGTHHIKAVYSGDNAYEGSSATLTETIKPRGTK